MTKAEREALKAEFVVGDYRTIKEFCEKKGIAYNGTLRAIAGQEHWLKDKNEHSRQIQGIRYGIMLVLQEMMGVVVYISITLQKNTDHLIWCVQTGT